MQEFYIPIAIECIEPALFPDVALYIKSGANFVLYKSNGRLFCKDDAERLIANKVDFLFISPADQEVINEYMENNVSRMLKDDDVANAAKGKIIYQTSINFVGDIFQHPEKVQDLGRSKRLIENLLLYLSKDGEAFSTLESVMAHNYHTFVHSLQVTALCLLLHSEAFLLSRDEMVDVGIGTLLHDFGLVFVPHDILNKSGKLTDKEIALFKKHPEDGYNVLKGKTNLNEVSLSIVRHHHERINGKGYPLALKGAQISRSAQAAAICDVYCSLTVDRTGKKALSPSLALLLMKQEMQGSFNETLLSKLETVVGGEDIAPLII